MTSKLMKTVPIILRKAHEANTNIQSIITVSIHCVNTASTSSSAYTIELTKSDDPLFYYHRRIDDDAFTRLKHEQTLLVSFDGFASMFNDLLDGIIAESASKEQKLAMQITLNADASCCMEIYEMGRYKNNVLLPIDFERPSNEQLHIYLARLINNYKDRLQASEVECQKSVTDKAKLQKIIDEKSNQLDRYKQQARDEIHRAKNEFADQLSEGQRKMEERIRNLQHDFNQLQESERKLHHDYDDLKAEYDDLKSSGARLATANDDLEIKCQELEHQCQQTNVIKEHNQRLQNEALHLREEGSRLQSILQHWQEEHRRLQRHCDHLTKQLRHEKTEVQKGVDVLRKLMNKSGEYRQEAEAATDKLTEKEREIKSLQEQLDSFRKTIEEKNGAAAAFDKEKSDFEKEHRSQKEKIDKLLKDARLKDSMIEYLNRQLTEIRMQKNTHIAANIQSTVPLQLQQQPLVQNLPVQGILKNAQSRINSNLVSQTCNNQLISPSLTSTPMSRNQVRFGGPSISPINNERGN